MNQKYRNFLFYGILITLVIMVIYATMGENRSEPVPFSQFLKDKKEGLVKEVTVQGQTYLYTRTTQGGDEKVSATGVPPDYEATEELSAEGIALTIIKDDGGGFLQTILIQGLPIIVLLLFFFFFMRQMQAGGGKAMSFGKSRARLMSDHSKRVTFQDVAGIDEARDEIEEIIDFLRDPKRFQRLGGRIPKGVLLMGPQTLPILVHKVVGVMDQWMLAAIPLFVLMAMLLERAGVAEDLYAAIGCSDISLGRVIHALVLVKEQDSSDFPSHYSEEISRETSGDVAVVGLKGLKNQLAGCCSPTPGDEIIGFITRGRGATVHRKDCSNILNVKDQERLVEVSWGSPIRTFPVPVIIKAYDRDGLTKDIATVLSNNGVSLTELRVDVNENQGEAIFNLVLGVKNVSELRRTLDLLERIKNVYEARRVRSV